MQEITASLYCIPVPETNCDAKENVSGSEHCILRTEWKKTQNSFVLQLTNCGKQDTTYHGSIHKIINITSILTVNKSIKCICNDNTCTIRHWNAHIRMEQRICHLEEVVMIAARHLFCRTIPTLAPTECFTGPIPSVLPTFPSMVFHFLCRRNEYLIVSKARNTSNRKRHLKSKLSYRVMVEGRWPAKHISLIANTSYT